ncbi:MAG: MBL fold metallo-hydrolase [Propionibacteriaceae bacterium]|jgi:glyoxylase-like metal-dependent hydrolase (beta-lactamase superfamily II)|nr:MBL fold metallo-hydrolase [Propionibacteriaceae bacterium]
MSSEIPAESAFQAVADRVWRAVAEPETVNIGLVAGDDGALLIDTGSSPEQGVRLRTMAESVAGVPLVAVFVTHDHYDHVGGLPAFADLPSYGHEDVPGVSEPFALVRVVDLGSRRVELAHFGAAHTSSDAVAILPDADVVFTGDLLESLQPPQFGADSSLNGWLIALDSILSLLNQQTILLPGHGEPFERDYAFDQRMRLAALLGNLEYLRQRHIPIEDAPEAVEWPFDKATIAALLPLAYAQQKQRR